MCRRFTLCLARFHKPFALICMQLVLPLLFVYIVSMLSRFKKIKLKLLVPFQAPALKRWFSVLYLHRFICSLVQKKMSWTLWSGQNMCEHELKVCFYSVFTPSLLGILQSLIMNFHQPCARISLDTSVLPAYFVHAIICI